MSDGSEQKPVACQGHCENCHILPPEVKGGLSGGRLVLAAAGVFIFPLVLAVAAGILFRGNTDRQALGVITGLVVGGLAASLTVRLYHRRLGEYK